MFIAVRQAGTWDLGPYTGVLAPGQMSPPATKYKGNYKRLKITAHMQSQGNYEQ